jgi:sugar-specific transcriptional regulator TrmB
MIHPKDYLRQIGLSNSEIALYLAGLTLAEATVNALVQATELKRPTVYHGLAALVTKGLATEVKEGKELRYTMLPPDQIEGYIQGRVGQLQQQATVLEQILPLFPTMPATEGPKSAIIRRFSGQEQVRALIDQALHCKGRHWDILAPRQNFIAESDPAYINHFKRVRKERAIQSCTLWEGKWEEGTISLADVMHRKPRYLPHAYDGRFKAMMIIFDKKVAFIGSYQQQEAILIESPEVVELQTMLFEALWAQAKKP